MRTANFAQDLLSVQTELLNFAYKLTADREEANDLLQETSLKALDNEDKYTAETNFKPVHCHPFGESLRPRYREIQVRSN